MTETTCCALPRLLDEPVMTWASAQRPQTWGGRKAWPTAGNAFLAARPVSSSTRHEGGGGGRTHRRRRGRPGARRGNRAGRGLDRAVRRQIHGVGPARRSAVQWGPPCRVEELSPGGDGSALGAFARIQFGGNRKISGDCFKGSESDTDCHPGRQWGLN